MIICAKYLFYEKVDFKKSYLQLLVAIENQDTIKRGIMEVDFQRKAFIADFNCNLTKGEELVLAIETLYELGKKYYYYLSQNGYEKEYELEHFKFIDKSDLPVDKKYDSNYYEVLDKMAVDIWEFVTSNFSELLYIETRAANFIKAIRTDAKYIKEEIVDLGYENLLDRTSELYNCKKDELELYLAVIFNYVKKYDKINIEVFDIIKKRDYKGKYTKVIFLNDDRKFELKEEE